MLRFTMLWLPIAAIAAVVGFTATARGQQDAPQAQITTTVKVDHRCPRGRASVEEYVHYAGRVYRRTHVEHAATIKLAYMLKCQHSRWGRRMTHRYHGRFVRERAARGDSWKGRWLGLPAADRAWATGTARCESGMNPQAVSPHGDHGAMQFKLATAAAAGFVPPDPKQHSLYEQLVRAVWWMHRAGKGQWPVCGAR